MADDDDPIDTTRMPLENRLRLADGYAAAHPGDPISALLIDLFPELLRLKKPKPETTGEASAYGRLIQARQLTRDTLAETLQDGPDAVAMLEKRTQLYMGILRRFVEAMDGYLDITAHFPEGPAKVDFSEISL